MSVRHRTAVEPLEPRHLLAASPVLVGNINQQQDQIGPDTAVQVGGVAFFSGRSSAGDGPELFKTDGTTRGTVLVRDINPNGTSTPESLTNVNGTLYFAADDGTSGFELWKSDGTTAGTVRVADLNPGSVSADPTVLTNINGTLYFSADAGGGAVLWKTDGTTAGTVRVTTTAGATVGSPRDLVNYNGTLVFTGASDRAIYTATGATATRLTFTPTDANNLIVFNNAVYFTRYPVFSAKDRGDVYKTDLTAAGTGLVKAIDQVNNLTTDYASAGAFTVSGDRLYFLVNDVPRGTTDFWVSDGTTAGTAVVIRNSGLYVSAGGKQFTPFGTRSVVFDYTTAATGTEPWVSDGTAAGTRLLKDLNPGAAGSYLGGRYTLPDGRVMLIASNDYGTPATLYTTYGTDFTTSAYLTIPQVTGIAYLIGSLNGTALFASIRDFTQGSLWKTNGSANGTQRLGASGIGDGSSLIDGQTNFFTAGDTIYFGADNGYDGVELYKSVAGGAPVSLGSIYSGGGDASPSDFTRTADGTIYFTARINAAGVRALYRLAPNATAPVVAVNLAGMTIARTAAAGNRVYFTANDVGSSANRKLWSYEPGAGAVIVSVNGQNLAVGDMVSYGGALYFGAIPYTSATSTADVQRLYRVRAGSTVATPELVAQISTGIYNGGVPAPLGGAGGDFYFSAVTAANGRELYKTPVDGNGVTLVADLTPGAASTDFNAASLRDNVAADGSTFYFTAYDATNTSRLYRTDGTAGGTVPIGSGVTASGAIAVVGGQTYFIGAENNANAIYRVDGTTAARVSPATTGDDAFLPTALHVAGGKLFAVGFGGNRARWELWTADAAFSNFEKVTVIGPYQRGGYANALSSYFTVGRGALFHTDQYLFFPSFDPATGIELYRLPAAAVGSISGVVFDDADADGAVIGDTPIAGDTIYLDVNNNGFLGSGETKTVATAAGYRFGDLVAGTYVVRRLPSNDGRRQTAPYASPAGPQPMVVTLAAGQTIDGRDFATTVVPPVAAVANAAVNEGGSVVLSGAGSYEAFGSIAKYEWDLDYDGAIFDVSGGNASTSVFNASTLDGNAQRQIALRVTDVNGLRSVGTAVVTINNVAPVATFTSDGPTITGAAGIVRFVNPVDAAADLPGLRYSFDFNNNGSFADAGDVSLSTAAAASVVFAAAGTYTVHGRVTDKDGGQTDYTTTVVVTAVDPQTVTLEGEAATYAGGTAAANANVGYTGTGYADFAGISSSAQWSVSRLASGAVTLGFRYANGGTTNRPLAISVNGTVVGTLSMPPTGSWTTWQTVTITANLNTGTNTIKAAASTSVGGANVDSLTVVRAVPSWLSPGAGAAYTLSGNTLTVTAGVVTLLSDVAATHRGLNVVVSGNARLLTGSSQHLGSLTLSGTANVVMTGLRGQVLRVTALTLATTTTLDLNEADLILDYASIASSPAATVRGLLAGARDGGGWTGTGLTSTAAKSDAARRTTLGYLAGPEYKAIYGPNATFANETIDDSTLLVRHTLYGDTDLDRGVSINDFNRLSGNFGGAAKPWLNGDFDYDNGVSINDFNLLAGNFGTAI